MADPAAEVGSVSRRTYLFLLFGVGGVAALISLLAAVYGLLSDALDGTFGAGTIADIAPALAIVITTGAIAWYHWVVFTEDRSNAPDAHGPRLRDVILVGVTGDALAEAIRDRFGVRATSWDRHDGGNADVDVEAVLTELDRIGHERALVIASSSGHQVIPFSSGE
jgi:hypothetical protein